MRKDCGTTTAAESELTKITDWYDTGSLALNRVISGGDIYKGIPKGSLTIITIGELKGIKEAQNASGPSGLPTLYIPAKNANIMISVTGKVNCDTSSSLSTAEANIAKIDAYSM